MVGFWIGFCIAVIHKRKLLDIRSRWVLTATLLCVFLADGLRIICPVLAHAAVGACFMGTAWYVELFYWRHPAEPTDADLRARYDRMP